MLVLITCGAALLGGAVIAVGVQQFSPLRSVPFHGSYALDVTHLRTLMDNTSDVFVARIDAVERGSDRRMTTVYAATTKEIVKGRAAGKVHIEQYGYVDDDGVRHVFADQPRLKVGHQYLVATNPIGEAYFVMAGPMSVSAIDTGTELTARVREYRSAAQRQFVRR